MKVLSFFAIRNAKLSELQAYLQKYEQSCCPGSLSK